MTLKNHSSDKWSLIFENQTGLIVPIQSIISNEPERSPVFFNPAAKFNRDVSIYIYKHFIDKSKKKIIFADSMCGLGARGLRVGNEISDVSEIVFNDYDTFSIQVAKINAVYNSIYDKCKFINQEICKFSSNFDYNNKPTIVDLDPFGTPSTYLDCVLRMVQNEGLISVTATDTAVLLGVYPKVCYRKYYGYPLRSNYSPEIGTRLLLSSIALVGSRLDLFISPLFAHSYRNYIRVYCKVVKSNRLANRITENLGYVYHCFSCKFRTSNKASMKDLECPKCMKKINIAGPLWISNIFNKELIKVIIADIHSNLTTENHRNKNTILKLNKLKDFFEIAINDIDYIPFYYQNDEFGKLLKRSTIQINKIVEKLNKEGYLASQSIFSTSGFKSDASITKIKNYLDNFSA